MKPLMKYGKASALLSAVLLCLPSVPAVRADGPAVPANLPAAQGKREPAKLSMDVVTNAARDLPGAVVNSKSAPAANAKVVLSLANGKVAQEAITDATGRFLFKNVRPGVYTLTVAAVDGQTQRVARVWTEETAPPAATPVALVSLSQQDDKPNGDVVRGQFGLFGPDPVIPPLGGGGLLAASLVGLGVAAAIAIPIAVSNSNNNVSPSSP